MLSAFGQDRWSYSVQGLQNTITWIIIVYTVHELTRIASEPVASEISCFMLQIKCINNYLSSFCVPCSEGFSLPLAVSVDCGTTLVVYLSFVCAVIHFGRNIILILNLL